LYLESLYGFTGRKLLALDHIEVDLLDDGLGHGLDAVVQQHGHDSLGQVLQRGHARHLRQLNRQVCEGQEHAVEEGHQVL
jgi:hypothetical protein